MILVISLIVVINLITFTVYGIDKNKAVRGKWRISEFTLLCLAFLGGAPAALLGMLVFNHKTKKWKFRFLIPLFLIIQVLLVRYI